MTDGLVLPGIGGSGEAHWQSLWEAEDGGLARFAPADWDRPELAEWTGALERALSNFSRPPLLIAHSLACLLVAHAAERLSGRVRGAFLVAVPDPDGPAFPVEAASFRDVPARALPFPALILASSDDPYGTTEHARRRARGWGAPSHSPCCAPHSRPAPGSPRRSACRLSVRSRAAFRPSGRLPRIASCDCSTPEPGRLAVCSSSCSGSSSSRLAR